MIATIMSQSHVSPLWFWMWCTKTGSPCHLMVLLAAYSDIDNAFEDF